MPRHCGPCKDNGRIELDRRLLNMELSGESFRTISLDTGYSESALKRHKSNHLGQDVQDIRAVMQQARIEALEEAKAREREEVKGEIAAEARETTAARLESCADYLGQLRLLREKAADILDEAAAAGNLKSAIAGIREARACIETLARIEGQLKDGPQINLQRVNIYTSPEWDAVGLLLARILEDHPGLRTEVAAGLIALQEGQDGA